MTTVGSRPSQYWALSLSAAPVPDRAGFIERRFARAAMLCLVGHDILEQDAAVRPDAAERNAPVIEQPHEIRTRDVQQLRCFLRGQLGMMRDQANRIAVGHLGQNGDKEPERDRGDRDGFAAAVRPDDAQLHSAIRVGELRRETTRGVSRQLRVGLGRSDGFPRIEHKSDHKFLYHRIRNKRNSIEIFATARPPPSHA
jgi:hypothetical protein